MSAGNMGVIGVCHVITMSYFSCGATRHKVTDKSYGDFNSTPGIPRCVGRYQPYNMLPAAKESDLSVTLSGLILVKVTTSFYSWGYRPWLFRFMGPGCPMYSLGFAVTLPCANQGSRGTLGFPPSVL